MKKMPPERIVEERLGHDVHGIDEIVHAKPPGQGQPHMPLHWKLMVQ
ncbi:MAG TPA: hypothetical protein PKX44_04280 [Methanomassiliicoccaceae archaeon]|nr:hypothetical protein [Methanomassiliicoccaceae archaeon]